MQKETNKVNKYLKMVNLKFVRDMVYYDIPNIIPSFFIQVDEIMSILFKYLKHKKYLNVIIYPFSILPIFYLIRKS